MTTNRKSKATVLREAIHQLVDELPSKELHGVKRFLAYLRNTSDALTQKLMESSYSDEPLTKEEENAVDEAWEASARGEVLTDEELGRQLGL